MQMFWGLVGFILLSSQPLTAQAQQKDASYYQIGSVETQVLGVDESSAEADNSLILALSSSKKTKAAPAVGPLEIINTALSVWNIIEKNKPVVTLSSAGASALPSIASQNWQAVVGWKAERIVRMQLTVKNVYGMTVVDFQYDVRLMYGGNVNGKGLYIASARIVPNHVNVSWGFDLDVKAAVAAIYNAGTVDSPLAAMNLDLTYTYSSLVSNTTGSASFKVGGNGFMQDNQSGQVFFSAAL